MYTILPLQTGSALTSLFALVTKSLQWILQWQKTLAPCEFLLGYVYSSWRHLDKLCNNKSIKYLLTETVIYVFKK